MSTRFGRLRELRSPTLFGTNARMPRPVVYALVYGVFIAIVGITATAQTVMVSANFSTTTLESVVGTDAALVRTVVNSYFRPTDLDPASMSPERRADLEAGLARLVRRAEIMRLEVRLPDGQVVVSDQPGLSGSNAPASADFRIAVEQGQIAASIDQTGMTEAMGPTLATAAVLREYFPLQADGRVQAVVGLWRDATPLIAELDRVRTDIVITTLLAALVAAVALSLVFRAAQGRITRQAAALLEATRRDPLTGLLNHGALVGELAIALESARAADRAIGIALVDVDGFRLLNETYGHAAGDLALRSIVAALEAALPASMAWGRYGPDEFLVIAPGDDVSSLGTILERLRASLAGQELQFDASERLPLTVSAGICTYPEHADSVTALLSAAAVTLQEARSGGGDAVRFARHETENAGETRTFDVFQGLVLAVDTKDRYTKRHSEDVARFAVYLGELLELDDELIRTLHVAGLLHDVGKIGLPDHLLRKPGRLTADELRVVQQHVALGDSIIRDLPNIDVIRAGVRHHHERWDGNGYLDRLAGEEIPLVARILSVGDAFSAMTTTRPYRKALPFEEALRRLQDAAGTQLDERLVNTFVAGVDAHDVEGQTLGETRFQLWTPYRQVA